MRDLAKKNLLKTVAYYIILCIAIFIAELTLPEAPHAPVKQLLIIFFVALLTIVMIIYNLFLVFKNDDHICSLFLHLFMTLVFVMYVNYQNPY